MHSVNLPPPSTDTLAERIRQEATRLGFERCRFAAAFPPAHYDAYAQWVASGAAGEMDYMTRNKAVRHDVTQLLPQAHTVVTVVASYHQQEIAPPTSDLPRGTIARYARGRDYHHAVRERLVALAQFIRVGCGVAVNTRNCVDALPILERDFAMAAGAGFIGKNTMLITPGVGSYTVLGELLLDIALLPDPPERSRCGRCRLCVDACPTGAIDQTYRVDARRCISYLTIELHGPIPPQFRRAVGSMIFGCDLCQEVCPYNQGAPVGTLEELRSRPDLSAPELIPLLALGNRAYRRFIRGTPLRRVPRGRFRRNVCVALGNSHDRRALPALFAALADRDALVREHAAWAIDEIGGDT